MAKVLSSGENEKFAAIANPGHFAFRMDDQRQKMINRQLKPYGVNDSRVLAAMAQVPREEFLPEDMRKYAYANSPLPIAGGQTISQPLIVGIMSQLLLLKDTDRVLEIGTGSGYQTALLASLARFVFTVELLPELSTKARQVLGRLGYKNIAFRVGDGSLGWPEEGPYDAILVTAGGPRIPQTLLAQLVPGGRLVMPVGSKTEFQQLVRVIREGSGQIKKENHGAVRFVPLVGKEGWRPDRTVPVPEI